MRYTTYLFDFDYTLADSSRGIVICFRNVLERHGHTGISDETIKRTIGKTLEESFSILTGITSPETLAAYKKEYVKEADTHMTVNTVFFPETVDVLMQLKRQGAKLGIISTKYRYRIHEMLDKHLPANFFDIIIGGEDVKKPKPHPQGIRKALWKLHRTKAETLYIGDSTVDAQAAQQAKVDFAGVLNGMTTREELAAFPHRQILDNLTLLPLVERFTPYKPCKYVPTKVTAWYRLIHQKQIRGKAEEKENTKPYTCMNCGKAYEGNYCPHCGQARDTSRFTIRNAFQNILSGFFNIDDGFSRNLFEFLIRPGYMIRDYLSGKRVHYFKPFQTLFVMAALYIMAVQLIDPEAIQRKEEETTVTPGYDELIEHLKSKQKYAAKDSSKYFLSQSIAYTDSAKASEATASEQKRVNMALAEKWDKEKKKTNEYLIGDIVETVSTAAVAVSEKQSQEKKSSLLPDNSFINAVANLMKSWIHGNKAFSILALLPIFTLGTRWSFRRTPIGRRINLTENFFAQVYIACQILWISLLVLPFTGEAHLDDIFDLNYAAIFALFVWDYRQLFGISWRKSFWRTIVMFCYCLLAITLICTLIISVIVLVAYTLQWYLSI